MNYTIPEHITKQADIFKYLKENKSFIARQKKAATKHADEVMLGVPLTTEKADFETKEAAVTDSAQVGTLQIKVIGNTTNLMDSHDDVHIPGLWKKTLSENKYIPHLQEHKMQFDKIITDETSVSTKTISWKSIGVNYEGSTQALIMESTASIDRNPYMCEQYKKGYVKMHSAGMQYVNYVMCINSSEKYYAEEKANWDKYFPMVANQDRANAKGYFFAILEAKLVEISAVPIGSNRATPTQSVTEQKEEADIVTSAIIEPDQSTHKQDQIQIIHNIKF